MPLFSGFAPCFVTVVLLIAQISIAANDNYAVLFTAPVPESAHPKEGKPGIEHTQFKLFPRVNLAFVLYARNNVRKPFICSIALIEG